MHKTIFGLLAGTLITHASTEEANSGRGNISPARFGNTTRIFVFPDPSTPPPHDHNTEQMSPTASHQPEAPFKNPAHRQHFAPALRDTTNIPSGIPSMQQQSTCLPPDAVLAEQTPPQASLATSDPYPMVSHHMDFEGNQQPNSNDGSSDTTRPYWADFPGAGYVPSKL